jgi:electron transport complex protein RnfG
MNTLQEPEYRKRVSYQAMLLGGFSTLATALLVAGNLATKQAIAERQKEDLLASLSEVLPADRYNNDLLEQALQLPGPDGKPLTIYRGAKGLQVNSLAWEVVGQGYAGEIRVLLGVDEAGKVIGARVLAHAETPGLGDKIEVAKDTWILDFNGRSLGDPAAEEWAVVKDGGQFDAFSGATITPRAVIHAIKGGLAFFAEHKSELLSPLVITSAANEHDE